MALIGLCKIRFSQVGDRPMTRNDLSLRPRTFALLRLQRSDDHSLEWVASRIPGV